MGLAGGHLAPAAGERWHQQVRLTEGKLRWPPAAATAPESGEGGGNARESGFVFPASSSRSTSRGTRQIEALGEHYKSAAPILPNGTR